MPMHRYVSADVLALVAICLGLCAGLWACKGPGPKRVGEATLALALGTHEIPAAAENAPVVEVLPDQVPDIPKAPLVKLAIDRKTRWRSVQKILQTLERDGQTAMILVAKRRKVQTFRLSDEFDGPAIEVTAYTNGKACVRHPDIREAKCVQSVAETYIDAAFTRQLVREAVNGYFMRQVEVDLPADLSWGDAVRTIDGSRTCCKDDDILVKLR